MSATLRALRKLVLGETLALPIGVAVALAGSVLAKLLLPTATWESAGGFVLLGLVLVALAVSLRRSRLSPP
jgi:hypothetical protein